MKYEEFIKLVIDTLGANVSESGATLYSSFNTVKKGRLYILGLNPGGNEDMTIEKSLEVIKENDYNEYLSPWYQDKTRRHPLQLNVEAIVNQFELHVKDICASNLIFKRSVGQQGSGYDNRESYWFIHKELLKIVRPEIIIAFGNGAISPYQHLLDIATEKIVDNNTPHSGHGNFKCCSFVGNIEGMMTTVIGLPHLSRYHLYTANPVKQIVLSWIKSKAHF